MNVREQGAYHTHCEDLESAQSGFTVTAHAYNNPTVTVTSKHFIFTLESYNSL